MSIDDYLGAPSQAQSSSMSIDDYLGAPSTSKKTGFLDRFKIPTSLLASAVGIPNTVKPELDQKIPLESFTHPKEVAQNVGAGAAQPSINLASGIQTGIGQGLQAINPSYQPMAPIKQDPNLQLIANAPNPSIAEAISLPASFAAPGGALMKGTKGIEALIKGSGLGALYGGAFGTAQDPNSNFAMNALKGAAIPAALHTALSGIGRIVPSIVKNRLDKIEQQSQNPNADIRTPQEAHKILDAQKTLGTGELPLSVGSLTNQPNYNSYYETGSKFPFAGQKGKMEESVGATNQATNRVYSDLFGNETPSIEGIKSDFKQFHKDVTRESDDYYKDLFDTAKQSGLNNIDLSNTFNKAKNILNNSNMVKQTGGSTVLDKYPEVKTLVDKFSKPVGTVDPATGIRSNRLDLEELQKRRSEIREAYDDLSFDAPKSVKKMLFNKGNGDPGLYQLMDKDIEQNIKNTGNTELQDKWNKASDFYKNNVVPLRNEKLEKVHDNKDTSEGIVNSLLGNKETLNLLPPGLKKQILGRKLIGSVEGVDRETGKTSMEVNASKLIKGYNNLDIKDKHLLDILLSPEEQNKLESLKVLHEATSRYRPQIKPPETGAKLAGLLSKGAVAATALGASMHPGTAGIAAGGLGLNRIILDLMSHPDVLKAYANPQLRNNVLKSNSIPANIPGGINSMLQYLINK